MSLLVIHDKTVNAVEVWELESRPDRLGELTGGCFTIQVGADKLYTYVNEEEGVFVAGSERHRILDVIFNRTIKHAKLPFPTNIKRECIVDYIAFKY